MKRSLSISHARRRQLAILVVLCCLLALPQLADAQCAMCKASAESNLANDPNSVARGINKGILYLMAVPYVLLMFIFRKQIVQLWRHIRKKDVAVSEE
jgi:hypothetical protein